MTRVRRRLSLSLFERWLTSSAAQRCVHRRGRPRSGEQPLVAEAARTFQVDRRTIERALVRIARRQRLLAEHQPIDAPTAALLLDAAKSFVVGENATEDPAQMRHALEAGTHSVKTPEKTAIAAPSRAAISAAVRALCQAGWISAQDLQTPPQRSTDDQLAAVGLRATVQPEVSKPQTPWALSAAALLDAIDAVQAQLPSTDPVHIHLDAIRSTFARS